MNTRYSGQPELSSSNITITISSSASLNSTPRSNNSHVVTAGNDQERSPPSFYIRLAMKVSRARWFIFLRRVFHYQNGSRSDLGSNPFNSSTWMMSELIALLVQLTVITFTLAISKEERPIWPVRLWITGYDVGCLLNLMLLYGRYRQLDVNQGNGFVLDDVEQQQRGRDETRSSHLMNKCRTSLELFFAIWFVIGNVWVFDSRFGSFHHAPKLHVLCVSLLTWNAICYSFPFLLFLFLCCIVPLISSLLGYNMNMGSSDRGASDDQISSLPSWKHKRIDNNASDSDSDSANATDDPRFGSFHHAPKLHVLCVSLLTWNAICYSFPFLLFLFLCCIVPLISSLLGYNMNMGSSDRGASDDQISSLPSWKHKRIDNNASDSDSDSANATDDPECCICLAKYKDKEEVRKLPCSHKFHSKCVDQWLRIISCCPLCKQDLPR